MAIELKYYQAEMQLNMCKNYYSIIKYTNDADTLFLYSDWSTLSLWFFHQKLNNSLNVHVRMRHHSPKARTDAHAHTHTHAILILTVVTVGTKFNIDFGLHTLPNWKDTVKEMSSIAAVVVKACE